MTQLSVKTLRHYHDVGLLEPDRVDAATGYRYYTPEQVATAQVVRRLRELGMPIADVRAVLTSPPADRNALISGHLERLESQLAATRSAVESLRAILERPAESARIEHRSVAATSAAAISATVDRDDLLSWWQGAVGELRATVAADHGATAAGVPGALFGFDIFESDRGEATVFIPVDGDVRPVGRVRPKTIPAAELAVIHHRGPHDDVDLHYSALGEYATRHEISVEGPLREYYECFSWDTDDSARWATALCWPVFRADA
jgi:DNA-binding transcriptional MerR regulator